MGYLIEISGLSHAKSGHPAGFVKSGGRDLGGYAEWDWEGGAGFSYLTKSLQQIYYGTQSQCDPGRWQIDFSWLLSPLIYLVE